MYIHLLSLCLHLRVYRVHIICEQPLNFYWILPNLILTIFKKILRIHLFGVWLFYNVMLASCVSNLLIRLYVYKYPVPWVSLLSALMHMKITFSSYVSPFIFLWKISILKISIVQKHIFNDSRQRWLIFIFYSTTSQ